MTSRPFGLYCPTSKASEVLMPRWTIQILGELWDGSTRFNGIRRGLPGISPTLLARRLREMQDNGLVERVEDPATGSIDHIRTRPPSWTRACTRSRAGRSAMSRPRWRWRIATPMC